MAEYTFRALTPADKNLYIAWLGQPHIGGWWKSGDIQWAGIEAQWAARDMRTTMQIAQVDGVDFAYVQNYAVAEYELPHFSGCARPTQAMDCFLGDPKYLGQGHGSGFIRTRATQLIAAGAKCVVVDPEVLNTHAIGSYTRAGFAPKDEQITTDGETVLVMEFTGESPTLG